ncbi:hypothetical protein EIK77_001505 [Talaromyces pinophilus]|jgi:hypothetical protein|nr:hypothetical protein EIK77_001505 [Talaromyces pinophilus]
MASSTIFSKAEEAANFLRERLDTRLHKPKVAIVCGSGLGGLADAVHEKPRVEIEYSSIPYFPQSTGMCLFSSDLVILNGCECLLIGTQFKDMLESCFSDSWELKSRLFSWLAGYSQSASFHWTYMEYDLIDWNLVTTKVIL